MNVQIGNDKDPRGSKMAQYARLQSGRNPLLAAQLIAMTSALVPSIGAEASPARRDPREQRKAMMAMAAGVGGPDCDPQGGCEQPIDPRVMASVMAGQAGNMTQPPAGCGITPEAWACMVALVNATKYCPSPARVGWQQDSLTFRTTALAPAASATINVTPTRAFCMSALVAAAGTSSDPDFTIDSLTYMGTNYVTVGPWIAKFYNGQAACCLCVRQLPVIDPNTTVTMVVTSQVAGGGANISPAVQVFGETLFCGSP